MLNKIVYYKMLNARFLINLLTVIFLVMLQVFIFSNISFNGSICPYIYVIFILMYPPFRNRYVFLLLCFLLGLGVDIFEDTGGINAFASVTLGYLSKHIIRITSGTKFFEIEEFRFSDFNMGQWVFYTIVMVLIHHLLIFFLEIFSFGNFTDTLLKALYSSAFTIIFIFFYLILFRKKEER